MTQPLVSLNDFAARGMAAILALPATVRGDPPASGPEKPAVLGRAYTERLADKGMPKPKGRVARRPPGELNQSELRYLKHLGRMKACGEIAEYWPHALKFRLADKTWYVPDVLVMAPDGQLSLHELKGWMEDDAAVKLKVTSELYWIFPVRLVREKPKGIFTVTEVGR